MIYFSDLDIMSRDWWKYSEEMQIVLFNLLSKEALVDDIFTQAEISNDIKGFNRIMDALYRKNTCKMEGKIIE